MARYDGLTSLYNRVEALKKGEKLYRLAKHKNPMSVIMIDIDHFKLINDTYGHQIGDQVIQLFSNLLKTKRNRDTVIGRYGGEEFIIFLNHRNNTKIIIVPDVTEQKVDKAIETLKKKGFTYEVKKEASDKVKKGYVIETQPSSGSSKRKGSIITIIESTGLADVVLKDYTDQNATSVKEQLEKLGLKVTIEKKVVKNPKDYVGKSGIIIDQNPKYDSNEEITLKKDDEITLYIPDIYEEYPEMVSEGWTLAKAEEFANQYGLSLIVKDKKGNVISDYSSYLDKAVTGQNRTGKIASGVQFVVTIDMDMSSYNLTVNYIDKDTNAALDKKVIKKKDGDSGSVNCDVAIKSGYALVTKEAIPYQINGKDVSVTCYYINKGDNQDPDTSTDNE